MADLVYNNWYQSSPVLGGHNPAGFRAPASHANTGDKARSAIFGEKLMKMIDELIEKIKESQEQHLAIFQQRSEKFQIPSKTIGKEQTRSSEKEEFPIDVCGGQVLEKEGVLEKELEGDDEMRNSVQVRRVKTGKQKQSPNLENLAGGRKGKVEMKKEEEVETLFHINGEKDLEGKKVTPTLDLESKEVKSTLNLGRKRICKEQQMNEEIVLNFQMMRGRILGGGGFAGGFVGGGRSNVVAGNHGGGEDMRKTKRRENGGQEGGYGSGGVVGGDPPAFAGIHGGCEDMEKKRVKEEGGWSCDGSGGGPGIFVDVRGGGVAGNCSGGGLGNFVGGDWYGGERITSARGESRDGGNWESLKISRSLQKLVEEAFNKGTFVNTSKDDIMAEVILGFHVGVERQKGVDFFPWADSVLPFNEVGPLPNITWPHIYKPIFNPWYEAHFLCLLKLSSHHLKLSTQSQTHTSTHLHPIFYSLNEANQPSLPRFLLSNINLCSNFPSQPYQFQFTTTIIRQVFVSKHHPDCNNQWALCRRCLLHEVRENKKMILNDSEVEAKPESNHTFLFHLRNSSPIFPKTTCILNLLQSNPGHIAITIHLEDKVEVWAAGSGKYGGTDGMVMETSGKCKKGWKEHDPGPWRLLNHGRSCMETLTVCLTITGPNRSFFILATVMKKLVSLLIQTQNLAMLLVTMTNSNPLLKVSCNGSLGGFCFIGDSRPNLLNLETEGAVIHEHFRLKFVTGSIGFSGKKLQHKEKQGKVSSSMEIQVKSQPREGEDSNKYLASSQNIKRQPTFSSYSPADYLISMVFIPSFIKIVRDYYPP